MSGAYTEEPNNHSNSRSSDGSDSMDLNDLYTLTIRKESNRFWDHINPIYDGQLMFHSGFSKIGSENAVMMWNTRNPELYLKGDFWGTIGYRVY